MGNMVCVYAQSDNVGRRAHRRYSDLYPNRKQPNRKLFQELFNRLGETGSFRPKRDNAGRTVTVHQEEEILVRVTGNPEVSSRQGFAWPAMHSMTARWIPPNERSKFVTAYLGSSIGASLTYPICGFIIDRWGWEVVFYTCGVMGMLWFFAWGTLVYDSPSEHPRISEKEREYILTSLGQSVATAGEKAPVPWLKIVTSVPVWMNVFAQWGGVWGLFTLMTHAPTYFKFIHGWNIRATGLLSGMPHLLRMLWAAVFSQLGDYLLRSNKMTRSNVRKLATIV